MSVECIDQEKCTGCGICVETCPMDVFQWNETTQKTTIGYPEDCQICHLCRIYCPENAITISPVKCVPPMVSWG